MKLKSIDFFIPVFYGGEFGVLGRTKHLKPVRKFFYLISMTHPDGRAAVESMKKKVILFNGQRRSSVFTFIRMPYLSTEVLTYQLHSVADAKHRNAHIHYFRWSYRRIIIIDTRRSSGKNQCLRIFPFYFLYRSIKGKDLRIYSVFSDFSRDQLSVLRTEIKDQHSVMPVHFDIFQLSNNSRFE